MLAAVLVPAAFARPLLNEPAGHHGPPPPPSSRCPSPTRTGPALARVGENYTISGCGFAPGSIVPLELTEADGCCLGLQQVADANGRFAQTSYVWGPGLYRTRAMVKRNNRWRVVA